VRTNRIDTSRKFTYRKSGLIPILYNTGSSYKPRNPHLKVWRFLDFAKFVDMLERKALFFSSVMAFDDPYEGKLPSSFARLILADEIFVEDKRGKDGFVSIRKRLIKSMGKRSSFVNCWYLGEYESDGMWQLYSNKERGIAIRSTFKRLVKSIEEDTNPILIEKVKYIDYDKFRIKGEFYPLMYKRK
jgi:hypothetical protein